MCHCVADNILSNASELSAWLSHTSRISSLLTVNCLWSGVSCVVAASQRLLGLEVASVSDGLPLRGGRSSPARDAGGSPHPTANNAIVSLSVRSGSTCRNASTTRCQRPSPRSLFSSNAKHLRSTSGVFAFPSPSASTPCGCVNAPERKATAEGRKAMLHTSKIKMISARKLSSSRSNWSSSSLRTHG